MSEYTIGWAASLSGLGLVLGSTLYWLGGRRNKWQRRFVGSFVLTASLMGVAYMLGNFSWHLGWVWLALAVGFSLGYGADTRKEKIKRRSIYALGVCSAGLICAIIFGAWRILVPHLICGVLSVYLGVINPVSAAAEEYFICMVLNLFLMAYPFAV